jgi:hypothetical protein
MTDSTIHRPRLGSSVTFSRLVVAPTISILYTLQNYLAESKGRKAMHSFRVDTIVASAARTPVAPPVSLRAHGLSACGHAQAGGRS